jgi:hypothetical protein
MYKMTPKNKKTLPEHEIDLFVVAQADNDSAWEKSIAVHHNQPVSDANIYLKVPRHPDKNHSNFGKKSSEHEGPG